MVDFLHQQGTLFFIGFSFLCAVGIWGLNRLQRTLPSPVNKAIVRWIRLIGISLFLAVFFQYTLFPNISFWRLFVMGFLIWGLLETAYVWMYILAWDKSELPLFPSIQLCESVEWPANKRFFLIRDWIRQNGYQEIGGLKYYYKDEMLQSAVVFQSPDKTIRMQVLIVPDATGVILDQIAFISEDVEGNRYITDNIFMPFGGVYPENWKSLRFPAKRKIQNVANKHISILAKTNNACVQILDDPLEWTVETQIQLEKKNIESGFLNEKSSRSEFGKMTGEGRYRIWKELLILNYFCKN